MANFFDVGTLDYYFHAGTARDLRPAEGNRPAYQRWMLRADRPLRKHVAE